MASIRQYRRAIQNYLKRNYQISNLTQTNGANHYQFDFFFQDKPYKITLNERNSTGSSSAIEMKLQDIRRLLGPPSPQSTKFQPRTLETMTQELQAKFPVQPEAEIRTETKVPETATSSFRASVRLRSEDSGLIISIDQAGINKFYENLTDSRGTSIGFTAPDMWTIRHSSGNSKPLRPSSSGGTFYSAAKFKERFSGPFSSTPASATLIGGRFEIKLLEPPRYISEKEKIKKPQKTQIIKPKDYVDVDTHYLSPTENLRIILTQISQIEKSTPYRLRKIKVEDTEIWEWRAPSIRIND